MVNWDIATTGCEQGDLGIPDLGDMNAALLVKWIFPYGIEVDRFWKKLVCTKSEGILILYVFHSVQEVGDQLL